MMVFFFFKQKTAYEIGLGIPAGTALPILALSGSPFSRSGWLWPVDAKGEPLKATSYMAVGFYVAKYRSEERRVGKECRSQCWLDHDEETGNTCVCHFSA